MCLCSQQALLCNVLRPASGHCMLMLMLLGCREGTEELPVVLNFLHYFFIFCCTYQTMAKKAEQRQSLNNWNCTPYTYHAPPILVCLCALIHVIVTSEQQ
ncbi:hypothetical protein DUNSADRAFT_12944 [Dunaliella salina]|uniref:Secreted protein n=1 Tax=Dunaliella salina TaxID=3046 RepID=A0ABQ7GAF5_DUNSA|nr:hypothetical protein DUNSADRAFT_12944 [Dunaliella salina]|eukprot:KAF5831588.1 hypothetical protein DUNSADRAFT_12944 [Dunaliella salina]